MTDRIGFAPHPFLGDGRVGKPPVVAAASVAPVAVATLPQRVAYRAPGRRVAVVGVNLECLAAALFGGKVAIESVLRPDEQDFMGRTVSLAMTGDMFGIVADGADAPEVIAIVHQTMSEDGVVTREYSFERRASGSSELRVADV